MERRRSASDIALTALLALSVVVTAAAMAMYFSILVSSHGNHGYFEVTDSRIATLEVKLPGIVRFSVAALLQLAGMAGLGFVMLARRPVRSVWPVLACTALAFVEVDRFLLALPEQPRTTNWFHFGLSHGFLPDALQTAVGLLVAVLFALVLTGRLRPRWTAVTLPPLVAAMALQIGFVSLDVHELGILRLMSITWAYEEFRQRMPTIGLSVGLVLFDLALLLFAVRALKHSSFHASREVLTAPSE